MTKLKVMQSPVADIQRTVDTMVAKAKNSADKSPAVTTKVAKIHRIQKGLNMPDILTYLEAFTDLPEELIDELMLIVEKAPSALAVKMFAKKWDIV